MSQYSLSTCDPLKKEKADRKDVRRAPRVTGSVGTVLFEAGTMDTFAPSRRETGLSLERALAGSVRGYGAFKTLPPTPSRVGSIAEGEEFAGDMVGFAVTPTRDAFARDTVFDGPVFDSPSVSRASTMDEAASLLAFRQVEGSSSSAGSCTDVAKRARTRPSPLGAAAARGEQVEEVTPVASPTTPSALARAFGALFKGRR